jgi:hypothetical protein
MERFDIVKPLNSTQMQSPNVRTQVRQGPIMGDDDCLGTMLKSGQSYSAIQAATGCSRATVAKIARRQAA